MSRGRRWLGGLLCVVPATLLGACGETSQPPGGASLDRAGNGGGAASGSGGAGIEAESDPNCPTPWPKVGSACRQGQRCFHPGSTNPCAPPATIYICNAGTWQETFGPQNGTCDNNPEACPGVNLSTGCPWSGPAPAPGTSCGQCAAQAQASCQFGALTAKCVAGLWQVTGGGTGGTGGTGDEAGAGGAP